MKLMYRILIAIIGLMCGAAVVQQLQRPPEGRTWHGRIFGIPYDFRPPTAARLRSALWNKDNPALITPRAFGMGWSINFYRLLPRGTRR